MSARFISALCAAVFCLPGPTPAEDLSRVVQGIALSGWRTGEGTHVAALRLVLAPGWKTYWRAPGETGIPPQFFWEGNRNVDSVELHWPLPEVYYVNGMRAVGYTEEVTLPLIVDVTRPGEPAVLAGRIELGVCREVCMPVTLRLDMPLPADSTKPDPRILTALASAPLGAGEAGVAPVSCTVAPIADGMQLRAELDFAGEAGAEVVVEYIDKSVWVSEPDTDRSGGPLEIVVDLVPPDGRPFALARGDLTFTVFADGRVVELQGCNGS